MPRESDGVLRIPLLRERMVALALALSVSALVAAGCGTNASPLPTPRAPTPTPAPSDPPWIVRVPHPSIPPGPRRIGIQAGHWKTDEVPDELAKLRDLGGAVWGDVAEWEYTLDIAKRVVAKLAAKGYAVDLLSTTVPEHYLADVFVSLHADGDSTGTARGFKIAHGERRGPHEDALTEILGAEFARATGLPMDPNVTEDMRGYYAFRWERFRSSVVPHTPAALLEMGFITNAADRSVLLNRRDAVADGIVNGVVRFLDNVPSSALFRDDLVFPRATPAPSP